MESGRGGLPRQPVLRIHPWILTLLNPHRDRLSAPGANSMPVRMICTLPPPGVNIKSMKCISSIRAHPMVPSSPGTSPAPPDCEPLYGAPTICRTPEGQDCRGSWHLFFHQDRWLFLPWEWGSAFVVAPNSPKTKAVFSKLRLIREAS